MWGDRGNWAWDGEVNRKRASAISARSPHTCATEWREYPPSRPRVVISRAAFLCVGYGCFPLYGSYFRLVVLAGKLVRIITCCFVVSVSLIVIYFMPLRRRSSKP